MVVEAPTFIVARKDFPPKDLKEFVAYVKANAEKLNMAHAGVGSGTLWARKDLRPGDLIALRGADCSRWPVERP
jgi:hypothetical protein